LQVPTEKFEGVVELVDPGDFEPPFLKRKYSKLLRREMIEAHIVR
jgi:hypothetical protein